jgi:hypothetical protein
MQITKAHSTKVSTDVFANNRLSLTLVDSNPSSGIMNFFDDEYDYAVHMIPNALTDPEYRDSYEVSKTAFMYSIKDQGVRGGHFDWMQLHVRLISNHTFYKDLVNLPPCIRSPKKFR